MRSMIVGLSILVFAGEALAQTRCYFANGTVLPNVPEYNEYQPCSGIGSICCGTNRDNPAGGNSSNGFTADECLPNGLCQNRITADGVEKISWWVDFCSDSNINSGNCLNICDQVRNSFGNTPLTPCNGRADSERWCCGDSNACCTSNVGVVRLAQVFGGVLSSSIAGSATPTTSLALSTGASTSATASTSGTGSSSSSPSSSSSTTPNQGGGDSGLSSGAIAGIVIGVVAGLALLAAAIFFWRRSAKYKKQALGPQYAEAPGGYPGGYRDQEHAAVPVEKYGKQQAGSSPIELPPAPPSELPSGDYAQYAGQHPQK
ncbi:hypothetical protein IQ07DRAFT_593480 [Pyrenochaeta sp. DS3sAY3a]|nr:hypothetical protein IQ07DRAFT_593480 [Pyrenochaeta sp. DS3sAY3a]